MEYMLNIYNAERQQAIQSEDMSFEKARRAYCALICVDESEFYGNEGMTWSGASRLVPGIAVEMLPVR